MPAPKAVREGVAESERLAEQELAKLNGRGEGPSADDVLADAGLNEPDPGQGGPVSTPPDTEPAEPESDTRDYKALYEETRAELVAAQERHASLLGKYNHEVPRLHDENRRLKDENASLKHKVEAAEQQPTPEVPSEEVEELERRMSEEFSDDLVRDFSKLTKAIVARNAPKPNSQHETRIEELQARLDQMEAKKVDDQLDLMVPNWRTIERSPDFQKLLGSAVPRTNGQMIYDQLLNQWYQAGNVAAIVQFFNEFLNDQKRHSESTASTAHVEPDTGGSVDTPSPRPGADQKVWKVSEIEHINNLAAQGAFKKRKQELAELRTRIEKAAADGRIEHDVA